jgi:hypothetical protein
VKDCCVDRYMRCVDHGGVLRIFRFKNGFCAHEVGGNMKRQIPKVTVPTKNIFSIVDLNEPISSNQSNLGFNQMYISTHNDSHIGI